MRMDHYVKTGNNNIHLANILYAILLVGALVITLTFLLNKTIRADFKNIDLINLKRKEKRDERRRRDNTEDEKQEIWDKWSKQGEKYNKKKNFKIFDEAKTLNIDFNYYIKLFNVELKKENKKELPYYETIKPYTPLIEMNNNIKVIKMNNEYIYDENYKLEQVKPEYFLEYDTLIIESGTGTGKTTNVGKHIKSLIILNFIYY